MNLKDNPSQIIIKETLPYIKDFCVSEREKIFFNGIIMTEKWGVREVRALAPSKQTPPFFTLIAETDFLKFKEPLPFKMS